MSDVFNVQHKSRAKRATLNCKLEIDSYKEITCITPLVCHGNIDNQCYKKN